MLASLGTIVFEGANSPVAMGGEAKAAYAQHALIDGKPLLQRIGTDLEKYQLDMILRPQFANPEASILGLRAAMSGGTVLPFVLGNGQYLGNFVIEGLVTEYAKTLADGSIIEARVRVDLLEYYSPDLSPVAEAVAQAVAFARSVNRPVPVTIPDEAGDGAAALASVKDIRTTASRVNGALRTARNIESRRADAFAKATAGVQRMNASLENARTLVTQGVAVIKNADRALSSLNDLEDALVALSNASSVEDIAAAVNAGNELERTIRFTDAAFSGLAGMVTGRTY
jgi:phage protein U